MTPHEQDLYSILDVSSTATQEEIRAAYYQQVRHHPPEKDEEGFQRVQAAFDVLSNHEARREYDELRATDVETRTLIEEGRNLLEEDDPGAVTPLKRALVRQPESLVVRDLLVQALMAAGELGEAERQARILTTRSPGNPSYQVRLGDVLRDADRDDEAEAPYRTALALDQETPIPVIRLAYLFNYLDRPREAIELLREAIYRDGRVDFEDFLFFQALCRVHINLEDYDSLLEVQREIREILPPDQETRSYVAWFYYQDAVALLQAKNFDGAFHAIEEAVAIEPSLPELQRFRANIALFKRAMDEARTLRDDQEILTELRYSVGVLAVILALDGRENRELMGIFNTAHQALYRLFEVEGVGFELNIELLKKRYPAVAELTKKFLDDALHRYQTTTKRYVGPERARRAPTRSETGWQPVLSVPGCFVLGLVIFIFILSLVASDDRGSSRSRSRAQTSDVRVSQQAATAPPRSAAVDRRHVKAEALNLRAGPGAQHQKVAQLQRFDTVLVEQDAGNGWLKVRGPDGHEGFVAASYIGSGDGESARTQWCSDNAGTRPRSGEILRQTAQGEHVIEIENAPANDALIKLKDYRGTTVLAFYVRAGETVLIDTVPEGTYKSMYASGSQYSRTCGYFLNDLYVAKLRDSLEFKTTHEPPYVYTRTWQVTLYEVANGNLTPQEASLSSFMD